MNRDDALDAFLAVVNTVRPDHPRYDRSIYPLSRREVEYGVTRTCYARCGPRSRFGRKVYYATRMSYINRIGRERHLALLVHEVTHIPFGIGTGTQHGGHPPEFWREMAFLATELRDALQDGALDGVFEPVDIDAYLEAVGDDPNASTVDRRYWSVEQCEAEVRTLIGLG